MPCRLIINADDFGWSEGVNQAVCALYEEGVLTSTSLMVAAPAFEDAVERARERPGLAVGLHVALVHAPALLPRHKIPHLVDRRGWFSMDPVSAGLRYTFLPACRREVGVEVRAQFARFAETGLPWSHVDSHLHFSMTPVVFQNVMARASEYPVAGFRIPIDDFELYRRTDPQDAAKQKGMQWWVERLCGGQRPVVESAGYATTRFCYGYFRTGRLDPKYLAELVRGMPDGDFELHCHPDLSTEAGKREFEALGSAEFRAALRERGVILARYAQLKTRGVSTPR